MHSHYFKAVIFDLDGVVTDTAKLHTAAWKKAFDDYLQYRSQRDGTPFSEFTLEDYLAYVDGKPEPDIFIRAASNMGVAPPEAVVVEDAVSGVAAGRKGGFGLVLGIAREDNADDLLQNGADMVVSDMGEITIEEIDTWFESKTPSQW